MKKLRRIIATIIIFIVLILVLGVGYYKYALSPVSNSNKVIRVEIPKGSTGSITATILKKNGLIKDVNIFKLYLKTHNVDNINYGQYNLKQNMSVESIVDTITKVAINQDISILFKEGENMRSIAKTIASNTNNTKEDVYNLLKDETYIDSLIEKYWFIKDTIKDANIYYPLEGYLAPDTYRFTNKDVTVKQIFKTMLDQMNKILTPYKNNISKYSIHEYLTLASIVEEEGKTLSDRKLMIGVFENRLAKGDRLGSDVTTYYAAKLDDYSKTPNFNLDNPYNTRSIKMSGKLPIGPISAPSKDSIEAAINPTKTNYYYFVSDKNGKIYFFVTETQFQDKIKYLKAHGLWL